MGLKNPQIGKLMRPHQKDHLMENKKDDATTLFLIQQGLDESILPKIATAARSKGAWNILEMTYSERGINTNQHQSKLQSIAVVDKVSIVTVEVEEFDIAEIIEEVVEEHIEAEQNKQDMETSVVLNIA
jgi:hypothetical protein